MAMKFDASNIRSLYRAGSLMTVEKEISNYTLDLVGLRRSDGVEVTPNQQANIHFSVARGMTIMN
jgi:hypothetical protein